MFSWLNLECDKEQYFPRCAMSVSEIVIQSILNLLDAFFMSTNSLDADYVSTSCFLYKKPINKIMHKITPQNNISLNNCVIITKMKLNNLGIISSLKHDESIIDFAF